MIDEPKYIKQLKKEIFLVLINNNWWVKLKTHSGDVFEGCLIDQKKLRGNNETLITLENEKNEIVDILLSQVVKVMK